MFKTPLHRQETLLPFTCKDKKSDWLQLMSKSTHTQKKIHPDLNYWWFYWGEDCTHCGLKWIVCYGCVVICLFQPCKYVVRSKRTNILHIFQNNRHITGLDGGIIISEGGFPARHQYRLNSLSFVCWLHSVFPIWIGTDVLSEWKKLWTRTSKLHSRKWVTFL